MVAILNCSSMYCLLQRLAESSREDFCNSTLRISSLSPAGILVLTVDGQDTVTWTLCQPTRSIHREDPTTSVERPRASSEDSWSHHQLCVPILLGDPPLVHRTYGIHTCITNTQLDWFILNGLFQDRSCLTIGECSLDYTAEDIDKQQVFRRQVQMAMLLEKPLVLHLRGGEYRVLSSRMRVCMSKYIGC